MEADMKKRSNLSVHEAHTITRALREGKTIDRRTKLGKYLHKTRQNLISEVGGDLNEGQKIILERIMVSLAFVKMIMRYVIEEKKLEIVDEQGNLLSCLNNHYLSYQNSLTKNLTTFYELGRANK